MADRGTLWTTFDILAIANGRMQPQVEQKNYDNYYTFQVTPCRFATKVSVYVNYYSNPPQIQFVMEYNNAGIKLFEDEKVYHIKGGFGPEDLKIEGYRTKTITLARPPPKDDEYYFV